MHAPEVSVVMATYNHAPYVRQAVDSVLSQGDVDLEFLIADDGSTDATREVVGAVDDPRVTFFPYTENRGACAVTNELVARAAGSYVAVINSDDYWIGDDKLSHQLRILEENPQLAAVFGRVRFIDHQGEAIAKSDLPHGHVFDQEDRSRGAWLRYFFDVGNCLCHPSILIRRECYDKVGSYDNRLRQLPDWDMWIRLVKQYDIHVSDRDMVAFRVLPGQNASGMTVVNSRRGLNETYFILRDFFRDMPQDVFLDGFSDRRTVRSSLDSESLAIEQAFLYLEENPHTWHVRRLIGLDKLRELLGTPATRKVLLDRYEFDDRSFQQLTGECATLDAQVQVLEERLVQEMTRANELNARFVDAHSQLSEMHVELARLHRSLPMRIGYAANHPATAVRGAYRRLRPSIRPGA